MPTSSAKDKAEGRSQAEAGATDRAPASLSAFDLWLDRGLHKLFDDIAHEPVPEALLKIVEQDRSRE